MTRAEFPVKVRKAAYERSGGKCECCGRPFGKHPKERPHYDHVLPDFLGGKPTLENCEVLRRDCHEAKTARDDTPKFAKVRREDKRRKGWQAPKRKIPGSKGTGFKKKLSGKVIKQ